MGLELPLKIQAVVTIVDRQTLKCEIDTSKVPSLGLAIAMLEQAVRVLKNEEMNQSAVLFGNRMMKEASEAALAQAVVTGRKQ